MRGRANNHKLTEFGAEEDNLPTQKKITDEKKQKKLRFKREIYQMSR